MRTTFLIIGLLAATPLSAQTPDPSGVIPRTRASVTEAVAARFRIADTNQDGAIDQAEAARMLGISPAAAKAPPFEYSVGADGRPQLRLSQGGAASGMLAMMFAQIDSNRDGKLQLSEAQAAARQRFDRADRNRDGALDDAEMQSAKAELTPMLRALGI